MTTCPSRYRFDELSPDQFLAHTSQNIKTPTRDRLRFVGALNSLTEFPDRWGLAPENDAVEPEVRQLLYGKRSGVYRALFTLTGQEVRVLHIRHAARTTLTAEELAEDI